MQRVHLLATLLDVFVGGLLPLQVRVDQFAPIGESRQRFAKAVQRLAAHDAIAGGKSHIDEMLEERVQSRQEFFLADTVTQGKYAAKAA